MKVRYTVGSKPEHRSVLLLNVHEPEKRTAALGAYFNGGTIFGYIRRVFEAYPCKSCFVVNKGRPSTKPWTIERDHSSSIHQPAIAAT
jgi:hypothetical protein